MSAYREAWRLAWPLILSNLSIPLLGMVDTAVVGHLPSPHYLGAVALGTVVLNVVYFLFGFLRMGTTGLTAQAFGGSDLSECRAWLARGVLLACLIAITLVVLAGPLITAASWLLEPGPRVEDTLETYVAIRLLGAPAALVTLVLLGWLMGMQNARGPMALLIVTNGLNMALDLLFVLGFGWAVAGVAWATVCAEYGWPGPGALAGARRHFGPGAGRRSGAWPRSAGCWRSIATCSCAACAWNPPSSSSARWAPARARSSWPPTPCSSTSTSSRPTASTASPMRPRRWWAARSAPATRRACAPRSAPTWAWHSPWRCSWHWSSWPSEPVMILALTGIADVRATAMIYLPYLIVAPLVSVWAFLFDGVFIGATRTAEMRNGMAVSLAVFLVAAWLLVPVWGNHGLWLSFLVLMSARGLWLGVIYARHKPEVWVAARR